MFTLSNRKTAKEKVFCVGLGKTGTTTVEKTLSDLGFKMGDQARGELLIDAWAKRDFDPIIKLCGAADAFQDVPFCLPFTFQELDRRFPAARFILSLRNSPEAWLSSLIRFHSSLWADGQRAPTAEDLKRAHYRAEGHVYRAFKLIFDTPDDELYNTEIMLDYYRRHEAAVREYFRHRPGKLIVINVANSEDYPRLCDFLERAPAGKDFPWLNKT
jgi:hypothetical protein